VRKEAAVNKWRIVGYEGEPFTDREDAGRLLAGQLGEFSGRDAVVIGIPGEAW
jgi:hypothetical protein